MGWDGSGAGLRHPANVRGERCNRVRSAVVPEVQVARPDVELRSGSVRTRGAEIAYDVCGAGDPLVLLHAGIADRRMWDGQLEPFAAAFRVVRIDLRGFGDTTADRSPFTHHGDVDAVLDALGIGGAHVVGASMGGAVALDLALHHPERVAGLALIGSALDGYRFEDPELRAGWERTDELVASGELESAAELELSLWVAGPHRLVEELDDDLRARLREMLVRSYALETGDEQDSPGGPAIDGLAGVTAPTLVLVGALDRPDIHRIADLLTERLPAVRRIRLAGVAHLPSVETPERVNRLILEFLEEVEAGAFPARR